jgi:hypothetical protein
MAAVRSSGRAGRTGLAPHGRLPGGPGAGGGGPRVGRQDQRPAWSEPDQAYVARLRAQHETRVQVSGPPASWDYRYPAHLTGPRAAAYPPPPEPEAGGIEPEMSRTVSGITDRHGKESGD